VEYKSNPWIPNIHTEEIIIKNFNQNQTRDDEIAKLNDIVTHAAHT
jgi:hypothetical protein